MKGELFDKPAWLDLPDEQVEPKRVQLWAVFGKDLPGKRSTWWKLKPDKVGPRWRCLYATKEEAYAAACEPADDWTWNGKEPSAMTLEESLARARNKGDLGVVIRGWRNGGWVTVRQLPCCVPYFGESGE